MTSICPGLIALIRRPWWENWPSCHLRKWRPTAPVAMFLMNTLFVFLECNKISNILPDQSNGKSAV